MAVRRWDLVSAVAGLLTLTMTVVYVRIQIQEGGFPFALVFAIPLATAVVALVYASLPIARHRKRALAVTAVVLVPVGFLGVMTIGLPLLFAAMLVLGDLAHRSQQPQMPTSDPDVVG